MNGEILIQGKNLKGVHIRLHIFMKQESLINKEISKDTYLAYCILIITLTLMCMNDDYQKIGIVGELCCYLQKIISHVLMVS